MKTPIKRHITLQPLSRDHHSGLLLCWKIREGLKKQVDYARIRQYTDWYWRTHLQQHFEEEEQFVFPVLGPHHPLVMQALAEHERLKQLFNDASNTASSLGLIEQEMNRHIRFEERVLFNAIEQAANDEQLQALAAHQHELFRDEWPDAFWA